MRRRVVLVVMGTLLLSACGGAQDDAADRSASPTTDLRSEPIVIRTRMVIAAEERTEPIASGEVLEGSTLGGSPFCIGGTILDSHGSPDPEVWLIARTITCPDGKVRIDLTPGSWTIVSGTGAFEGLSGSGKMQVSDPDDDSQARETLTGTVTR
jgi:hypothetical protein